MIQKPSMPISHILVVKSYSSLVRKTNSSTYMHSTKYLSIWASLRTDKFLRYVHPRISPKTEKESGSCTLQFPVRRIFGSTVQLLSISHNRLPLLAHILQTPIAVNKKIPWLPRKKDARSLSIPRTRRISQDSSSFQDGMHARNVRYSHYYVSRKASIRWSGFVCR